MKQLIFAVLLVVFVAHNTANAQQPGTDSVAVAKRSAKITKLTNSIAEQKAELARLEGSLADAQKDDATANARAADAAATNAKLAERLQNDPTDKRASRKARKAAKAAKKAAKRGRRAGSSLDSNSNRVEKLRKSILKDEKELAELVSSPAN